MSEPEPSAAETFNPWSVVNLVFHHLAAKVCTLSSARRETRHGRRPSYYKHSASSPVQSGPSTRGATSVSSWPICERLCSASALDPLSAA